MTKAFMVLVALLLFSFTSPRSLLAQVPESEDAKYKAELKRNEELKRQLNAEIKRQNELLEQKLKKVKEENAKLATPDPATPAANANPTGAGGNGNGNTTTSTPTIPNESANTSDMGAGGGSGNATSPVSMTNTSTTNTSTGPQGPPSPMNANCFNVFIATAKPSRLDQVKCFLARSMVNNPDDTGIDFGESEGFFLMTLIGKLAQAGKINLSADAKSFVLDVEASRTDKQLGADPKASGTTSLAVKGGIPSVLSWAVENGAAVASSSGNTYTFRVNPVGFIQALAGTGYITGFQRTENDPMTHGFLRNTSVGFTFDTTRGTNPPTLIGSKQQLSAISARYNFINQRDPRASRYQKLWDEFFQNQALDFTQAQTDVLIEMEDKSDPIRPKFKNSALQKWLEQTNAQYKSQASQLKAPASVVNLNQKVTDSMMAFIEERINALPLDAIAQDPIVAAGLRKFVDSYRPFLKAKEAIMKQVRQGTLATFEYTNFRDPNAPDLSNFRFVVERGMLGGVDLTANASLTFFNKRPVGPNVQRLRDFDFSGQLDKKLPDAMGLGPATLSFAGKYQRLTSNAVAFDGTVLPNTRGDIAAGQVKLILPIKDSGIKIPFSITFANRTELVREREVRGNFGFTFDFDTLFARFKSITPR